MQCKRVQKQLTLYAKSDLSQTEHEKVAAHLQSCSACNAVAAEYARLAKLTEDLPEVKPPAHILDELQQNVRRQIFSNPKTTHQTNRRPAGLLSLFNKPRFAYTWGSAVAILLAIAIWFGSDWNPKPERRTLESYLVHRDYFSLWHAFKKPDEQKLLLEDSVPVDLLVQTIDRYDEIKKRYGRFRSASVSLASLIHPTGENKDAIAAGNFLKLNDLQPLYLRYAKTMILKIRATRAKISLKELLKKLKISRLLLRQQRVKF